MKLLVTVAALIQLTLVVGIHAEEPASLTPDQAWQRLKEGNQRFAADKVETKDSSSKKRQELAAGQHPIATVLTCADSRVPPEQVFNQGLGDLFVLRVAGNISDPYVLGSIEYGVEHLHVPLIVVLGHDECGAVKAALGTDKLEGNLATLIREVHPGTGLPTDPAAALRAGVKNNVEYHTGLLVSKSDVVKKEVDQKKVRIVSGVYSLSTGQVQWLTGN